ncbi:MAG: FixH family protein [Nitrospirota bacterium]|nr:MAG: FixH family protein [Nitrospirota bacterium]
MKIRIFFIILIMFPVIAIAGMEHKHMESTGSISMNTDNGNFAVKLSVHDKEMKVGKNRLDIMIEDKEGHAVKDANIEVVPWMPGMGHGVDEKAVIKGEGNGMYIAENVVINMGGEWEIRISVNKGELTDIAVFKFQVAGSGHGHEHKMNH